MNRHPGIMRSYWRKKKKTFREGEEACLNMVVSWNGTMKTRLS